jgi:riboflavin kinase/FMN adenylyltransferase
LSIETHLFDFNRDVYGKEATLEFLMRLRDERRFSGMAELVEQIQKDKENARRYFQWLRRMTKCE